MGVIIDVVIADTKEAEEICRDINSPTFTYKATPRLSHHMLVGLLCVLSKCQYTNKLYEQFPIIYDSDAAAVVKLSDELVQLLSKMDEACIPEIKSKWVKSARVGTIWARDIELFDGVHLERFLHILRELGIEANRRDSSLLLRLFV